MKKQILTLIILVSLNSLQAKDYIPSEVQRIIDIRKNEIKKIDEKYYVALIRQKERYRKLGEFEYAALADRLSKQAVNENQELTGSWTWTHDNGWSIIREINEDGTHLNNGRKDGVWEVKNNNLILYLRNGVSTFKLPVKDGKLEGKYGRNDGVTLNVKLSKNN